MNIVPYEAATKQMKFVYTVKYTVNFEKIRKVLTRYRIKRIISIYEYASYRIKGEVGICCYTV